MPDRIVRTGILTSDAVDRLSWPAEVFYRRLMNVADDHGRYDGRTEILRAVLYPLRLERVSSSDIGKWIRETEEAALVRQYHVEGKPFLEIVKFGQKKRSKSKWPEPTTIANNCGQVPTNDGLVVGVVVGVVDVDVGGEPQSVSPPAATIPLNDGTEYPFTEADVVHWRGLFPAVDIEHHLRRMREWCLENPAQRKTKLGVRRFVNRWLSKEQDKGGNVVALKPDKFAGVV